jgi:proline iminopeptidase
MGRFRTSDGIALRYERRGSGPPVYVCHGGPNNICDTLIKQLAALEDHFTLVFHDYRGSGQSASAPADTYRFGRLGDDLAELRRHLGDDRAAVLAHSMGGFVALNAVLDHPEGFHRLALVGASPCDDPKTMVWPTLRALGPMRTLRTLGLLAQFLVVWSWRPASRERTNALYAPMRVTQEARRELRAKVAAVLPEAPFDNDNAAHLLGHLGDADLRTRLSDVRCPVLVLYGSRDAVSVVGGRMLMDGLQRVEQVVLDDVGHEPFIEEPRPTFAALTTFRAGTT